MNNRRDCSPQINFYLISDEMLLTCFFLYIFNFGYWTHLQFAVALFAQSLQFFKILIMVIVSGLQKTLKMQIGMFIKSSVNPLGWIRFILKSQRHRQQCVTARREFGFLKRGGGYTLIRFPLEVKRMGTWQRWPVQVTKMTWEDFM